MAQLEHIEAIERRLWGTADTLRANSSYASNEYFLPVMGLVFLRHAYSRYLAVKDGIEDSLPTRGGKKRALSNEDFSRISAIFLQPKAQFDYLVALPVYDISQIDFDRLKQEFERSPKKRTTVQDLRQAVETRLQRLMQKNPLRTNFQRYFEEIIVNYNREKDRVTIENTFAALLKLILALDEEDDRAIREGLDEESLAIFDLLKKPELSQAEIKKIKSVAADLLQTLKSEKLRIDQWRDKESTRDAVRVTIHDFLYSDETGLPVDSYSEEDVDRRSNDVFRHVFRAYPTVPSPFYTMQP